MQRRQTCAFALFLAAVPLLLPVPAQAQTTALYFDSEAGDYIGQGQRQTWTSADLEFDASQSSRSSVRIWADSYATSPSTWWGLTFRAPTGAVLAPGVYENAARAPFVMGSPGLDVSGSGRGCNRLVGRFQIHEIEFDAAGVLTRFAADFEQHCEDVTPALFGAIRFDSTRSSLVPFDGAYPVYSLGITPAPNGFVIGPGINCGAGGTDCDEAFERDAQVAITATPAAGYVFLGWSGLDCLGTDNLIVKLSRRKLCTPLFAVEPGGTGEETPDYSQGAFFLDGLLGSGESWGGSSATQTRQVYLAPSSVFVPYSVSSEAVGFYIDGPRTSRWQIRFAAPPGESLIAGIYNHTVTSEYTRGASPVLWLGGPSCQPGGRFQVYEVVIEGSVLRAFAADFELPCGASGALVSGSIRYYSSRPALLPFDGDYPAYQLEIVPIAGGHITATGIACGDGGRTDCHERFAVPTAVTLQATPSSGYQFAGWTGSCYGRSPITAITVSRTMQCVAVFTPSPGSAASIDPLLNAATLFIDPPAGGSSPDRSLWLALDSRIQASHSTYSGSVYLDFDSPIGESERFSFTPAGDAIAAGDYDEVYSFSNGLFPLFDVPGCSEARGRVRVYEARFSGSTVLAFAADFEAFCAYGSRPHVVGSVRYRSSRNTIVPFDGVYPLYKLTIVPAPDGRVAAAGIDCGPGGHSDCSETYGSPASVTVTAIPSPGNVFLGWGGDCSGRATTTVAVDRTNRCQALFESSVPGSAVHDPRAAAAALLIDSEPGHPVAGGLRKVWIDASVSVSSWSRNQVSFDVRQADSRTWYVVFRARANEDLRAQLYEDLKYQYDYPYVGPSMSVRPPQSSYCSGTTVAGRFLVHEIAFESSTSGRVIAFAADFEYRCSADGPALYGSIRFNSTRAILTPFAADVVPPVVTPPDFDGDGWPDLIWRHAVSGRNAAWFMYGTSAHTTTVLNPAWAATVADLDWEIRAAADMNGDGRADLIWQHRTSGMFAAWLLDGRTVVGTLRFSTPGASVEPDLDWKIVGAADMNRDGHSDLLWRHCTSGALRVWHMNGLELWDSVDLPYAVTDPLWEVAGLSDMNGDG